MLVGYKGINDMIANHRSVTRSVANPDIIRLKDIRAFVIEPRIIATSRERKLQSGFATNSSTSQ